MFMLFAALPLSLFSKRDTVTGHFADKGQDTDETCRLKEIFFCLIF